LNGEVRTARTKQFYLIINTDRVFGTHSGWLAPKNESGPSEKAAAVVNSGGSNVTIRWAGKLTVRRFMMRVRRNC
jgi:hypothetical protein